MRSKKSKLHFHNFLGNIVVHIHTKYWKDRMKVREPIRFETRASSEEATYARGLVLLKYVNSEAFVILYMWGLKQKCVQQVKFG